MISKEEFLKKCETNIIKKLASDEEYQSLFRKHLKLIWGIGLMDICIFISAFLSWLIFESTATMGALFLLFFVAVFVLLLLNVKWLNKLSEINKSVMKNAFSYFCFYPTGIEVLSPEIIKISPILNGGEPSLILRNKGTICASFYKVSDEEKRHSLLVSIPYKTPCEAVITSNSRPSWDFEKVKPSFEHPFFKDNNVFMKDLSKQSVLLTPNLIEKITKIQSLLMPESLKSDEIFGMDVILSANQMVFVFETSDNIFELSLKSMILKNLFNFKVLAGKETVMYNINTFETLYNKLSNINQTIDLLGD